MLEVWEAQLGLASGSHLRCVAVAKVLAGSVLIWRQHDSFRHVEICRNNGIQWCISEQEQFFECQNGGGGGQASEKVIIIPPEWERGELRERKILKQDHVIGMFTGTNTRKETAEPGRDCVAP